MKSKDPSFFKRVSKIGYSWLNNMKLRKEVSGPMPVIQKSFIISRMARNIRKKHPRLFKDFSKAREELLKGSKKVNFGYFSLEQLNFVTGSASYFYKLDIDGKSFFVKEVTRGKEGSNFNPLLDDPRGQLDALLKTKKLISKDPAFKDFFVATPHFALSSKNNLFLATKFYEGISVRAILNNPRLKEKYPLFKKMGYQQIESLGKFLEKNNISDFAPYNLIYVPSLNKIVIFDLRLG